MHEVMQSACAGPIVVSASHAAIEAATSHPKFKDGPRNIPSITREPLGVAHVRPHTRLHLGEDMAHVVAVVVDPLVEEVADPESPPTFG